MPAKQHNDLVNVRPSGSKPLSGCPGDGPAKAYSDKKSGVSVIRVMTVRLVACPAHASGRSTEKFPPADSMN